MSLVDTDDPLTAGAPSHVALGGVDVAVAAARHRRRSAEEEGPVRRRLAVLEPVARGGVAVLGRKRLAGVATRAVV